MDQIEVTPDFTWLPFMGLLQDLLNTAAGVTLLVAGIAFFIGLAMTVIGFMSRSSWMKTGGIMAVIVSLVIGIIAGNYAGVWSWTGEQAAHEHIVEIGEVHEFI